MSNTLPKLNVLSTLPDPIAAAEAATAGVLVSPGIGGRLRQRMIARAA